MSQEKVNRYKEEKANRKEILKKQKMKARAIKGVCVVVLALIVGWIGYSVYDVAAEKKEDKEIVVNLDSINEYMADVSADVQE